MCCSCNKVVPIITCWTELCKAECFLLYKKHEWCFLLHNKA